MLYKIFRFIGLIFIKLLFRVELVGKENFPKEGPIIVAPNHKSNFDPIFVSCLIKTQIHWMAKKELYRSKILGYIVDLMGAFPVDRQATDIKAIKKAMGILKEKKVLGIFPEGTRVKNQDFSNPKSGVALIGHRTKSKIVPIYIDGNYKLFRKMRLVIRKPIDLSQTPKLNQKDYDDLALKILKSIYGVDEDRSIGS
ncbi:lysophospholipid acyltransferase family protein [Peptoniphilus catoniae]|uniref:lysophospholipid acyltransferase family protein n=1 Tax=Peptoniphilus catoniae TaxID=1660341 RepID=UPI0010FDB3BA|nr:lysophospholipid acyltransferase family protein [Peptoniphilus catoniae]